MQPVASFLAAIIMTVGALVLGWAPSAAFAVALLVPSITGIISYRISVVLGLICVALCPILLLLNGNTWLEQSPLVNYYAVTIVGFVQQSPSMLVEAVAIQAYYFLVVGVIAFVVRSALSGRGKTARS